MQKATEVFTPLAEDYARYRPGYPTEVREILVRVCGLTRDWVVADVGSGTGNLARLFLTAGHSVIGVEPNQEMREAGERLLSAYPAFRSLDSAAERISLPPGSVDIVTVGQALHWFEADRAKDEFRRILRGEGWVAVVWNDRLLDDAFSQEYHASTHSHSMRSSPSSAPLSTGLDNLFDVAASHHASLPHHQQFDLPGMLGRARSSGYLPHPAAPDYADLAAHMTDLFYRYEQGGKVTFTYRAQLFIGQLKA